MGQNSLESRTNYGIGVMMYDKAQVDVMDCSGEQRSDVEASFARNVKIAQFLLIAVVKDRIEIYLPLMLQIALVSYDIDSSIVRSLASKVFNVRSHLLPAVWST